MKILEKLPLYRQQVKKTLSKLKLTPLKPIEDILRDTTRRSFSVAVNSKLDKKRFIKIRLSETHQQQEFFYQSYWLGHVLNINKPQLYNLTSRLLDGQLNKETDYLLYEFVEGDNMGSRVIHDVFKFKKEDINNIVQIHIAIKELRTEWFPQEFNKRNCNFFRFLILEDVSFKQEKIRKVYTEDEFDHIVHLSK